MIIGLLHLIGISVILSGIGWGALRISRYANLKSVRGRADEDIPFPSLVLPVVFGVVGLLWIIVVATSATRVPGTHVAVIENTITGQFSSIGPGTHIFPFQPKLFPFVTHVTKYSLRPADGNVEVGEPPDDRTFDRARAVEADSNSPGRPPVYFWARVWAHPNKDMIVELHKRYGSDYLNNWVEKVYIAALKSVQGRSEYFFVGQERVEFQNEVEKALQAQLLVGDLNGDGDLEDENENTPIVYVQQLAVVNFDFSDPTKQFLQTVQEVEFARQKAEQQIEVNTKEQEAKKIAAQTAYLVGVRSADQERDSNLSRAAGEAGRITAIADAERYRIEQTYTAEAEGIRKVQAVLAQAPEGYLKYQQTNQWDGKLPQYMLGDDTLPFVDITPQK